MQDIYIVSAARTAVGTFGGALKNQSPGSLGTLVVKEALQRAKVNPIDVGHVVFGQVIPTCPKDAYLARVVGVNAGIPHQCPALTVNRLCGSGLQAVISAAQALMLGECDIAIAGGAEVMSQAPYISTDTRWGRKMGEARLLDGLSESLTDPFGKILMGVTAENVATKYNISRAQQDKLAVESHKRAAFAIENGYFKDQIVPVEIKTRKETVVFDTDEHVRPSTRIDDLARLRTIFKAEGGSVTAGNSSGINDGAAALVLATKDAVQRLNLKPLARIVSYAHAGVDPAYMGIGPIPASRLALEKAKMTVGDMDVIESNEAFAAQACAVADTLGFDPKKVNPNGSGISLGHPVGATGAIILTKAIYELSRTQKSTALVTMCIGGGQGIAAVIERV